MRVFLTNFQQSSKSNASGFYTQTEPQVVKKYSTNDPKKATHYIVFSFKKDSTLAKGEKAFEQMIYLPQTIDLHMRGAKNCLNLLNAHFLHQWNRIYNRAAL